MRPRNWRSPSRASFSVEASLAIVKEKGPEECGSFKDAAIEGSRSALGSPLDPRPEAREVYSSQL